MVNSEKNNRIILFYSWLAAVLEKISANRSQQAKIYHPTEGGHKAIW